MPSTLFTREFFVGSTGTITHPNNIGQEVGLQHGLPIGTNFEVETICSRPRKFGSGYQVYSVIVVVVDGPYADRTFRIDL